MSFTQRILIAMVAGLVVGILLNLFGDAAGALNDFLVDGVFYVVGQIFIAALKMMVVPLVLVSLVCGVTALGDPRTLGRVGGKALGLYFTTTAIAIMLALGVARLLSPGEGFELAGDARFEITEPPSLSEVLINMVPDNPVAAMADAQMLQIIVFALLLGFSITLAGERGRHVLNFFNDLNKVIMKMVFLVIKTAPVGVFALISRTFADQGVDILGPLAGYFVAVIAGLLLHLTLTYTVLLRSVGLSPIAFLLKMRAPMSFAFSTSSSSATIPVTLNTLKTRLGVQNSVASFTVPLGATINMDGTAIMQGVATVFVANVYGFDLVFADYLTVILTATLASIGTAAVPSAGLIMLAMVLGQIGLPVEGIALIIGIDRLLDMLRTAVNIAGDGAVTCFVARTEGAMDVKTFNDPNAMLDPAEARSSSGVER
ncbi:MAG TPA: dicarboxylate/amino acid:cation symporter [Alphaproteobacteria bacterium]|nr:dicarboxylate/amino acid:cation symporter [Alphaproteobacteria bacterium]